MVKTHPLTISITSYARGGKNTFAHVLADYLRSLKLAPAFYSFAEELKKECAVEIANSYGLDSFSEVTEEKNIFRNVLVSRAKQLRDKTKGNYFVKLIEEEIGFDWMDFNFRTNFIPIITDFRFAEYYELGNDELNFALKNGFIIHLEREGGKAANETELFNNDKISKIAPLFLDKYVKFNFPDCGNDIPKLKSLMIAAIQSSEIKQLITKNSNILL